MEGLIAGLQGISAISSPIANAADTQGLYTAVPNTVKYIMSNIFVQYLMLYFFVTNAGAEPRYALMFVGVMLLLLILERQGAISVPSVDE